MSEWTTLVEKIITEAAPKAEALTHEAMSQYVMREWFLTGYSAAIVSVVVVFWLVVERATRKLEARTDFDFLDGEHAAWLAAAVGCAVVSVILLIVSVSNFGIHVANAIAPIPAMLGL